MTRSAETTMQPNSFARFKYNDGQALLAFWRNEFIEHELKVTEPSVGTLVGDADFVKVQIRVQDGECEFVIYCEDASLIPDVRTGLGEHMVEFDPSLAPLEWSGSHHDGDLPPSLTLASVRTCKPLGKSWWRMTLEANAGDLARFTGVNWHFRLVRPTVPGRPPKWPYLNARGTIVWPEGKDKLSDRVYTVRSLDLGANTLEVDIYRHPGGPTCDWAESLPIGETVGIMGPGGKGGPSVADPAQFLLAGGDETAVPVMLRAIETLPHSVNGCVFMLVDDQTDTQPIGPTSLNVRWLLRSEGKTETDLVEAIIRAESQSASTSLWFAASQEAARQIREHGRHVLNLPRERLTSMAYWS